MQLEAREVAVFGIRPNPKESWNTSRAAKFLRQQCARLGVEPPTGPSSDHVTDEAYLQSNGFDDHRAFIDRVEQSELNRAARRRVRSAAEQQLAQ
jgi:hypothetical protein